MVSWDLREGSGNMVLQGRRKPMKKRKATLLTFKMQI